MTEKQEKDLKLIPAISEAIQWSSDDSGLVTIRYPYEDFVDRFNKFFTRKKEQSYKTMKLEKIGSFIFTHIDGKKTFREIADELSAEYGDVVEPLYERFLEYVLALWEKHYIVLLNNEPEAMQDSEQ